MKDWRKHFGKRIIERGKNYYNNGRVSLVSHNDRGKYTFSVEGQERFYDVKIKNVGEKYDFKCNCQYFKDGHNCKHIVASLLYIDNELNNDKKYIAKEDNPFIKKDGKYRYYDIEKITSNILFTKEDYEKAKDIVMQKKYKNFKVYFDLHINYDEYVFNEASCEISEDKDFYSIEAIIRFDKKRVMMAECSDLDCEAYNYDYDYDYDYNYHKINNKAKNIILCFHQLVVLILLDEYLEKNINEFDSTSETAKLLISQFKNNIAYYNNLPILNNNQKLEMELQFIYYGGVTHIVFKIGYDKTYIIKNISEFLKKIKENQVMHFGSDTNILLSEDNLSEKSKRLYNIIKKFFDTIDYISDSFAKWNYRDLVYSMKDIPFKGGLADEIFEYLLNEKIEVKIDDKAIKGKYYGKAMYGDVCIHTTINDISNKNNGESSVIVKIEIPTISLGEKNVYFFDKDYNICACQNEKIRNLLLLLSNEKLVFSTTKNKTAYIELIFGRNKISDFYNDILPILSSYGDVVDNTNENIKSNIKNKIKYLFRIDYKDYLLCELYKIDGENCIRLEAKKDADTEDYDVILCVKTYFSIYDEKNKIFRTETTIDEMYYILGVVLPYYMQIGEVEISENIKKLQKPKRATINVGVSVTSNLLDLNIKGDDLSKEEIEDILSAYNKKVKYYKTKKSDIIDVQNSDLDILNKLKDLTGAGIDELFSKNISMPLYRAIYLDELFNERKGVIVDRDEKFKDLIDNFENAKNAVYELPKCVRADLRNYQIYGYRWIKMLDESGFCGILADEMGLGKTLQCITYICSLYENGEKNISIIITPASLIYNWKQEFEKFAPDISVVLISGTQDERKSMLNDLKKCNVIITSYDLFKRDIDLYQNINFRAIIIDEAQYIKNQTTKASKSIKVIKGKFRLALTGTPIENRLSELWSIFDYLMPDYLFNYNKFRKNFELPIVKDEDKEKLDIVKKMISPFILRRKKEDVLKDLPEKIDNDYYVHMEETQLNLYKVEAMKLKNMIMNSDYNNDKIVILSQIMKLRQICCDPNLIYDNYTSSSAKKDACISIIQNAMEAGHKMLVFSQFTTMLDILADELKKIGIKYYVITGKTQKGERIVLVDKFNADDVPVFLISLKAGGTGLNLIGADTIIHYDPWWNVSVQNQATDRAHRIGQKKIVNIYKLITKNTIEEKIVEMQKKKEKISNDILSGELGGLSNLSKEELLDLVNI